MYKMIKYITLFIIVCALLSLEADSVHVVHAAGIDEEINLNLTAQLQQTHFLTPSATSISDTIIIDDASEAVVIFGSASKTLNIELVDPNGNRFVIGDPPTPAVNSQIFPDPSDPTTTGANYIFELSSPQIGTWSYVIQETVPLNSLRAVIVFFSSDSSARTGIAGAGQDYRLDREVRLALVAVDGANVLKDLTISSVIEQLGNSGFVGPAVDFRDDGLGRDEVADDGLYTASFQTGTTGDFHVVSTIDGVNSQGNAFRRTAFAPFTVNPVRGNFVGTFSDRSIDTNNNGAIDQIGVSLDVDIVEAGLYNVSLILGTPSGESLPTNRIINLGSGLTSVELMFTAEDIKNVLAADGPYLLNEAHLEFLGADPPATSDAMFGIGMTAAYQLSQFERNAIEFLTGSTAIGIDTDNNSKFDFLDVSIPVDFLNGGFYSWSGRLVDSNGTEVALAGNSGTFPSGASSLSLRFSGNAVGENGVDGPYFVRNLIIFGAGASGVVDEALATQPFSASSFEGYVPKDMEPPILIVKANPDNITPPNHKLIEITVDVQVSDNFDPDPVVNLEMITSNEGENAIGDGNTSPDIIISTDGQILLRAERSGLGNGRIYTLTYSARDAAGNMSYAETQVMVPHDEEVEKPKKPKKP